MYLGYTKCLRYVLNSNSFSLAFVMRTNRIDRGTAENAISGPDYTFESSAESDVRVVYKAIQRQLQLYLTEKRGPTLLAVQSALDAADLAVLMPQTSEFPMVRLHVRDSVKMFDHLQWQRLGSKAAIKHFLNVEPALHVSYVLT